MSIVNKNQDTIGPIKEDLEQDLQQDFKKTFSKVKVLFMGTPEFALPGFQALINEPSFEIIGAYTQNDKPVGRKQELNETPVKKLAREFNIPVFQPLKIKTEVENIKNLQPNLIVVIAYGKIVPQEILDIPKYGCINVHASLLPKYRGSSCLSAPILNGDTETGITIMKMEAGLDTGPILKQEKIGLSGKENLSDVHDALSNLGGKILVETLKLWIEGKIEAKKQKDELSTYVSITKKEDGKLDFSKDALELERKIRAYNPWPGTYAFLDDKTLKIIEAEVKTRDNKIEDKIGIEAKNLLKIGEIYEENGKILVNCGQNYLDILKLQLPGKKALNIKEFLNGNKDLIGKVLK